MFKRLLFILAILIYAASASAAVQEYKVRFNLAGMENPGKLNLDIATPGNNELINKNILDVNATVSSKLSSTACNLSIDNTLLFDGIQPNSFNLSKTFDLQNQQHTLDVKCKTGDFVNSSQRTFNINLDFSINTNKTSYKLNEPVGILINAPSNSNVVIDVIPPGGCLFCEHGSFSGNYPMIFPFIFGSSASQGVYTVKATLNYLNKPINITKNFEASKPEIQLSLTANDTNAEVDDSIEFTVSIGNTNGVISYQVNFGDGSSTTYSGLETLKKFVHKYSDDGSYNPSVIVSDNSGSKSASINVNIDLRDDKVPSIELVEPRDGVEIDGGYIIFRYKAYDSSRMECGVYLYREQPGNPGFFESRLEDSQTGIRNNTEYTFSLVDLTNGNYRWTIGCEDASGNVAFSSDRPFKVVSSNALSLASTSNTEEINSTNAEIIDEVNSVLDKFDSYRPDDKDLVERLGMYQELEDIKKRLREIDRDIHNTRYRRDLSETEKEAKRYEMIAEAEKLRDEMIIGIGIAESDEYVEYSDEKNMEDAFEKYIKFSKANIKDSEKKELFKDAEHLQSLVSYSVTASILEIDYNDGSRKTITVVDKKIKASDNASVVEYIPKEIADDAEKIKFFVDHEIIEKDPVILIKNNENILYYIEGRIELDSLKGIDTFFMPKDDNKKSRSRITGFAVSGLAGKIDWKWSIAISLVVGLLIAYAYYFFNPFEKNDKHIKKSVNKVHESLKKYDFNKVREDYSRLVEMHRKLPKKKQEETIKDVMNLNHSIKTAYVGHLLKKANSMIDQNKKNAAFTAYEKISLMYKTLPRDHQEKVYDGIISLASRLK